MDHEETDPWHLLMEISDPEERARTAREWGLADYYGGVCAHLAHGDGLHAAINRASFGDPDGRRPPRRPRRRR